MVDSDVIAVGWYNKEMWTRLKQIADDRDTMDATYDDWLKGWEKFVKNAKSTGATFIKIDVDTDQLAWWCQSLGRRLDSSARSAYVLSKARAIQEAK